MGCNSDYDAMQVPERMDPRRVSEALRSPHVPLGYENVAICEIRRCLVEDAGICTYTEASSMKPVDALLLYEQYHREQGTL